MERRIFFAPLLAAGVCLAAVDTPTPVQDDPQALLARRVQALTTRAMRDEGASGFSIFVDSGGRTLLAEGVGFEGWDPDKRADQDSPYRAGPLLEHFLAVAMLRLVQDGTLALSDPLEKLLPELRPEPWKGVELRHLLSHTSGVPSYMPVLLRARSEAFPKTEVLTWLAGRELDNAAGTCFEPSPTNTLLLGLILESKTERGVQDWISEQLFAPIELEATHWCWTGRGPRVPASQLLPFGAEGLCTNAPDLARWLRALVEGVTLDARHFELLVEPTRLPDGTFTPQGMGLRATRLDGLRRYNLGSSYAGSHLQVSHYPDKDLTVAVLATATDVALASLEQSLARTALGLAEPGIQDIQLSSEEQAIYVGGYYVGCNRLEIARAGRRLRLETADGISVGLLYQGENRFVSQADPGLSLTFRVEEGRAVSFLLDDHGAQTVARRID